MNTTVQNRRESGVERTVRIQPGEVIAGDFRSAVGRDRSKSATHQNLTVSLHCDGLNITVQVRVESWIERAAGIQACNFVAHLWKCPLGLEGCKRAADYNLAVGLDRDGLNTIVRDGVESCVDPAISV